MQEKSSSTARSFICLLLSLSNPKEINLLEHLILILKERKCYFSGGAALSSSFSNGFEDPEMCATSIDAVTWVITTIM